MRGFLSLLLLSCTQEIVVPRAHPPEVDAGPVVTQESKVRVAALNVHLLFDETCDSGMCTATSFETAPSAAKVEARVTLIADKLTALEAEVMMVEEVETQQLLDRIAAKMHNVVTHSLGEIGGTATVDVGVLSTLPLVELKHHYGEMLFRPDGSPTTFSRDLLEAHFERGGKRLIVFGAHFKAKANDDPGRRFAEAAGARDLIRAAAKAHPGALILLGGDLNDVPGSDPLKALDEAATRLSEGDTWWWPDGRGEPLDHIFVETSVAARYVNGSFRVVHDTTRGYASSDHAAVVADFSGF